MRNSRIFKQVLAKHGIAKPAGSLQRKVADDFFDMVIQQGDVNEAIQYDDRSNGVRLLTPLRLALHYGDKANAKKLLDAGAAVTTRHLHRAAQIGDAELIDKILDKGVPVNAKDATGYTALYMAASHWKPEDSVVMVDHLLERGADFYTQAEGFWGNTPLHSLISNEMPQHALALMEVAAQRGLHFETPDDHNKTALHLAAMVGFGDVVRALVAKGANIHAVDRFGRTPLHYAALRGCKDAAVALLEAGAKTNVQDKDGNTPLHLAYSGEATLNELLMSLTILPPRPASTLGKGNLERVEIPGEKTIFQEASENRKYIATALTLNGAEMGIANNRKLTADTMPGFEAGDGVKPKTQGWIRG